MFLFLTAPITATVIAKAYMLVRVREDEVPPTGAEARWGLYDEAPDGARTD